MRGSTDLQELLKNMNPKLHGEVYVFVTSQTDFSEQEHSDAVMSFKEDEGMTLILQETIAKTLNRKYEERWAFITLNVHSSLSAIGFMAAITAKLAQTGISINPISAFYHDHLFVPWEKRIEVMEILKAFK